MMVVGLPLWGSLITLLTGWICLSPVSCQDCVWFRLGKDWLGGKKGYLVIPMNQTLDGWKLSINTSSPLTSLEAWKGDVKATDLMNGTSWEISNRCYNSKLYGCQCLEIGIILRYSKFDSPIMQVSFNDIILPNCPEEPYCQPEIKHSNCPYRLDPESETLCQLVTELTQLSTNSTPYHSNSNLVSCPYLNNPTSAFILCKLWCQIENYLGNTCINTTTTVTPTTLIEE